MDFARRFLIAMILAGANGAAAAEPGTQPAWPITYVHEARKTPPLHVHIVTVDLTDPRVKLRVTRAGDDPDGDGPWQTTLLPTSAIAARESFDVAINGDFFIPKNTIPIAGRDVPYYAGNWARVVGLAMTDGLLWSNRQQEWFALVVTAKNHIEIGNPKTPPPDARHIVGGSTQLVDRGRKIADSQDLGPRTAVGVNAANTKLVILVIDGRRPTYSAGVTLGQLADEMIRLNCAAAINLDGGGSSTLVLRDEKTGKLGVANRPSDGHDLRIPLSIERPIANALGVTIERAAR
jgi:hypothetical protein